MPHPRAYRRSRYSSTSVLITQKVGHPSTGGGRPGRTGGPSVAPVGPLLQAVDENVLCMNTTFLIMPTGFTSEQKHDSMVVTEEVSRGVKGFVNAD